MGPHILKMLSKEGMDALPDALTPALADFFDAPTDSTPYDPTSYQSTQGGLIYLTPVHTDIKLPVNHLSTFNLYPTQSHRAKQIQLLRYLKGYPDVGPIFSANPDKYPNGPQLSFAIYPNGRCR